MILQLQIAGVVLVALAVLHGIFARYFRWREELQGVSLLTRQVHQVHTFFIAFTVFLMGLLCLSSAPELVSTPLGGRVCLGLSLFWALRLFIQIFGYSRDLWVGKPFETTVHITFTLLWIYLAALFLACALSSG